jgi:hypothetical protein
LVGVVQEEVDGGGTGPIYKLLTVARKAARQLKARTASAASQQFRKIAAGTAGTQKLQLQAAYLR